MIVYFIVSRDGNRYEGPYWNYRSAKKGVVQWTPTPHVYTSTIEERADIRQKAWKIVKVDLLTLDEVTE